MVDAPLVAGDGVSANDALDPQEQVLGDQRPVAADVLDALVGNDAEVIRVLQDAIDLRGGQRQALVLAGGPRAQTFRSQHFAERGEAVVVRGVELEGQPNQRRPLRIDLDNPYVAAVGRRLPGVEVAELGTGRRAAALNLLLKALPNLARQVLGIELGD